MTGYGKAEVQLGDKNLNITIKSVNSKSFDLNLRIPFQFKDKEGEIRKRLSKALVRGKVDFSMNYDIGINQQAHSINKKVLAEYVKAIRVISDELEVDDNTMLSIVSKFPNVLSQEKEAFNEAEWKICEAGIIKALNEIVSFRETEGNTLEEDLIDRVDTIFKLREEIAGLEGQRIENVKQRIYKQLEDAKLKVDVNTERFEQELIYYLEKMDITEEQVRLKSHGKLFMDTMKEETDQGRKLGFISQEIGREINTIGSKANHAEIQKLVVGMKDELEKIKEQLFNIL